MDSTQIGRVARAHAVLGATGQRRRPMATDELLTRLGQDIGQLRYWLNDMLNLVAEIDQANGQAEALAESERQA